MAVLGFSLFGVKDWAPYVVNVLLLFAFLLLVRRETSRFGTWPSVFAIFGALLVTVSFESVHQFRPDFPCALATIWGMVLYPHWKDDDFLKKTALSGTMFGLALLSKPPFFPYTLAMGALPWMIAIGEGTFERKSLGGMWRPILMSWPFFAATALVAGPHYILAWKKILDYIHLNQFGENAHVWKMTGGLGFQLSYHLFGSSGRFMLGQDIWILFGLTGMGVGLAIRRWKDDPQDCIHFIRLGGFCIWSWIFIAWNPHMNPFFGLAFQYGLVLVGMVALAWMLRLALDSVGLLRSMGIIPICLFFMVVWRAFPFTEHDEMYTKAAPEMHDFIKELPRKVYKKLLVWRPVSDSGYTFLSTYGIVSSHRLQWFANKDRQNFTFYGVPFWSLEKLIPLFEQDPNRIHHVDFVIISEPGAEGVSEELPNARTSGDLLEWMRKQEEYSCVDTLLTPTKKKYCLFMATPSFSEFESVEGLGRRSEPLNMAGTPIVRAATAGVVSLNYDSPCEGVSKVEIALRGQPPLAQVGVILQGQQKERFSLTNGNDFTEKNLCLFLKKGLNKIDLLLMDQNGKTLINPSVEFRRIRVTPFGDNNPMIDIVRKVEKIKKS
jgi:hypothetical protein